MANMATDSWLPHRFAPALRPAHDAERRAAHGRRVARDALLHARRHHPPRHDVLDQRLRDLLALAARDAALLAAHARARAAGAGSRSTASAFALCAAILVGHGLREGRAGRLGDDRGDGRSWSALCFLIRRHYRARAGEPEAARRDPGGAARRSRPARGRRVDPTRPDGGAARRRLRRPRRARAPHRPAHLPRLLQELRLRLGRRRGLRHDEGRRGGRARAAADARRRSSSTWTSRTG